MDTTDSYGREGAGPAHFIEYGKVKATQCSSVSTRAHVPWPPIQRSPLGSDSGRPSPPLAERFSHTRTLLEGNVAPCPSALLE